MIKQIALHGVQLSSEPVFERSTSGISVKFVATGVLLSYIGGTVSGIALLAVKKIADSVLRFLGEFLLKDGD